MPRDQWKGRLEPFAELYEQMVVNVRERLEGMTTDDLRAIIEDCQRPTTTNCGWSTYQVRDDVSGEARWVLSKRSESEASGG